MEKFLDLAVLVGALVDRYANLAAGLVMARECSPVNLPSISK